MEIKERGWQRALDGHEQIWRSLKYEDIYLKGYATVGELEIGVDQWFER